VLLVEKIGRISGKMSKHEGKRMATNYPSNIFVGINPSCDLKGEEVHSQTPPLLPRPSFSGKPVVALCTAVKIQNISDKAVLRYRVPMSESNVAASIIANIIFVKKEPQFAFSWDSSTLGLSVKRKIVI
jgi:hypothetical protein